MSVPLSPRSGSPHHSQGRNTLNRGILGVDLGPAPSRKKVSESQLAAQETPPWKKPMENGDILWRQATYGLFNLGKSSHLLRDSDSLSVKSAPSDSLGWCGLCMGFSNHYCYPPPYRAHLVGMECARRGQFGGRGTWGHEAETSLHLHRHLHSVTEAPFPSLCIEGVGAGRGEKGTCCREHDVVRVSAGSR